MSKPSPDKRVVIRKYSKVKDQWEKDRQKWKAKITAAKEETRHAVAYARELSTKIENQREALSKIQRKYDVVKGDLAGQSRRFNKTVECRARKLLVKIKSKLNGLKWRIKNHREARDDTE